MYKTFKIVAIIESISALLLFFFAMPMKYAFGQPEYVKHIGMAHGVLFIAFIILAVMLTIEEKWTLKRFAMICLASLIPFLTFYVDRKYPRPQHA